MQTYSTQSCAYTCSADPAHRSTLDTRSELANSDYDAWLATFDAKGRYLDPATGFWASLNGEFYSGSNGFWYPADSDE